MLRTTTALLLLASAALAQNPTKPMKPMKPQDTEVWTPVPRVVTPGRTDDAPPSDAVVLFDGRNLDAWVADKDGSPAKWTVGDSYDNPTYVNGMAASVYKQYAPLVNAMRKPGEWQTYDVIWTAPAFKPDGSLSSPAYVTAFQNGILVQNHVALKGVTKNTGVPDYHAHGAAPILLQAHGDPSPPISFRNIWLRALR